MDDSKDSDTITLVALERGFTMGRLVEPGEKFPFAPRREDGTRRKLPKWAATLDDPRVTRPKPKPQAGDLKPKAAQAAVKAKVGAMTGAADLA